MKAEKAFRDPAREAAAGIQAYLDAHPELPPAPELDDTHASMRVQLPAEPCREVTRRSSPETREAHIVAAITWWAER